MADVIKLQTAIEQLGLWQATGDDGRHRYRYKLIPGTFRLTADMRQQLGDIASLTTGGLQASAALSAALGKISQAGKQLTAKEAAILRMLKASCQGYHFAPEVQSLPPIVKVDLAWDGEQLQVLEIDTYNPRGLAYAFWLRHVHVQAGDTEAKHPVLLQALQAELGGGQDLVWLYSERERYYAPVLRAFAQVVGEYGINVRVVGEHQLPDDLSDTADGFLSENEKLLIVPDRMHDKIAARNALVQFALQYPERMLTPYVPHLGAKGLLAFLTNGNSDAEVAAWQDLYLSSAVKSLAGRYIPSAAILGKQFTRRDLPDFVADGQSVLKAINSSGAKGVYMPDASEHGSVLATARNQRNINFIAQKLIRQSPLLLEGCVAEESHLVRITAYVDTRTSRCLDAELTGTGSDPLVHGGSSCVQLPAIF